MINNAMVSFNSVGLKTILLRLLHISARSTSRPDWLFVLFVGWATSLCFWKRTCHWLCVCLFSDSKRRFPSCRFSQQAAVFLEVSQATGSIASYLLRLQKQSCDDVNTRNSGQIFYKIVSTLHLKTKFTGSIQFCRARAVRFALIFIHI